MRSRSSRRTFLKQASFATAAALLTPSECLRAASRAVGDTTAKLAIIVDDVGYNRSKARAFLELGVPLTFSILPQVTYSARLAEDIHRTGHEIMLHQPMQPHRPTIDPGPGALYVKHTRAEMETIVRQNLAELPFACGVNNHMGSLFTESQPRVSEMLDIFQQRSFFFVDSYTSSNSVAFSTARKRNMVAAYRNVFIDNNQQIDAICRRLCEAQQRALKSGSAIAIGHPRLETVRAIEVFLKEMQHRSVELVYVSAVAHERTNRAAAVL